jgi:hypothetical protein
VALNITAEGLIESGTALIGSPRTVLAGIERMRERTGFHFERFARAAA